MLRGDARAPSELELTAQGLALDAAAAEIVGVLRSHGIESLLLKGAGTAAWLYEHRWERPYGDIDLLVGPAQFTAARDALREVGFEPVPALTDPGVSTHHETSIRQGPPRIPVELHRTVHLLTAPHDLVWRRLADRAGTLELVGVEVSVPRPAAAAAIVTLHAVQHGIGTRKPMRDLELAIERADPDTWHAAAALARELGAGPAFAFGLRLLPAGRDLAERLRLPVEPVPRSVWLRAMSAPGQSGALERLLLAEGASTRLRMLARELVPTPAFMRAAYALARHGGWGLALAYLLRPVRLAGGLPAAVRAWLRAWRHA